MLIFYKKLMFLRGVIDTTSVSDIVSWKPLRKFLSCKREYQDSISHRQILSNIFSTRIRYPRIAHFHELNVDVHDAYDVLVSDLPQHSHINNPFSTPYVLLYIKYYAAARPFNRSTIVQCG